MSCQVKPWKQTSIQSSVSCNDVNLFEKKFEDTKRIIRICKLKKDRQHNGQKEKGQKDKQRSTKRTHKTIDRVTRTPLKIRVNSGASEGYAVPAPLVIPVVLI